MAIRAARLSAILAVCTSEGRGNVRSGDSFRKQLLRNPHRVCCRKPQIIRYSPEPYASGHVRVRLNRRQLNFAFTGDANVRGGRILRPGDLHAQILECGGKLLERRWCGKFRVCGESVAVKHRGLDQLNRRSRRAACEILSDVSGDCCPGGFEAWLALVAVLGKKIEGYLRVEDRLLDGAEGKQVCGLRFELVDSSLIALRNRRKKHGSDCSRRKRGKACRERAGNHDRRSGRGVCDFVWGAIGSRARLRRNQSSERGYPGGRFSSGRENTCEIDDGGACGLCCLPVSLDVEGASGEKCEAHFVEAVRFELADEGGFATRFREGSGHYSK